MKASLLLAGVLILFSVSAYAENSTSSFNGLDFNVAITNNYGESSYWVEKPQDNLKAKLYFPFVFYSVQQSFGKSLSTNYRLETKVDFLVSSIPTTGKDFDWFKNELSVFSKSKNKVRKYSQLELKLGKKLSSRTTLYSAINYTQMDLNWIDTKEYDFVKNESSMIEGNTLKYRQEFYKLQLGLNYKKTLFGVGNHLYQLSLEPSLMFAQINTKDSHLLRGFYTKQSIKTLGYKLKIQLDRKVSKKSKVGVYLTKEAYEKKSVNMDYFNLDNEKYMSLNSNYSNDNRQVGLFFKYLF